MYEKNIVCFANSRKRGGYCIAGKEWINGEPGDWIRPISNRDKHEISLEEQKYKNGKIPDLLDIIEIYFETPNPMIHQNENHLISPRRSWDYKGYLNYDEIDAWIDSPKTLYTLGDSSYYGVNDRIARGEEDGVSLYLVQVDELKLIVGPKAPDFGDNKRVIRGQFLYESKTYRLGVTDPFIEETFLRKSDGEYIIEEPQICVSLGDPLNEKYYKLIAAVICPERRK